MPGPGTVGAGIENDGARPPAAPASRRAHLRKQDCSWRRKCSAKSEAEGLVPPPCLRRPVVLAEGLPGVGCRARRYIRSFHANRPPLAGEITKARPVNVSAGSLR